MRIYVGQTRSAKLVRQLWKLGIGECTARGELPPRRNPYFYDNGAFKDWQAGEPFDESQFCSDIADITGSATRPDFIVLPDVVAGGKISLEVSRSWIPTLKGLAPLYLAVQDGMVPEDLAGVIGGCASQKRSKVRRRPACGRATSSWPSRPVTVTRC